MAREKAWGGYLPDQQQDRVRAERDGLVAVTMSPSAAERFREALMFFYCRESFSPPMDERQTTAAEHADWLRWAVSRVDLALETDTPEEAHHGR